jgi:hypothetical protein
MSNEFVHPKVINSESILGVGKQFRFLLSCKTESAVKKSPIMASLIQYILLVVEVQNAVVKSKAYNPTIGIVCLQIKSFQDFIIFSYL